ncbi:alpha/beta hydrolase [Trichothermofontia sp.]
MPPQTDQPAQGLIVMLHGWGANAQDLVPIAPLTNLPHYQFIFPEAPYPHPYSFAGKMWYDLESPDYQGLPESREQLRDWLQTLEGSTHIPLERTILSGFSQGGAMTLDVGLDLPLAGLVCFSGYLHPTDRPTGVSYPPVLILHGCQDQVVPLRAAEQAYHALQAWGVPVEYETYETMGHEIQPALLTRMQTFIQSLPQ